MINEPDCAEIVLLVTDNPSESETMPEWRPFKHGERLEKTIARHNQRCQQSLALRTPNLLAECVQKVKPQLIVRAHDLDAALELDPDAFCQVKIILLDLDALGERVEKLGLLEEKISFHQHVFHLIQVSNRSDADSAAAYLDHGAYVALTYPEVFHEQAELSGFLDRFCEAQGNVWRGVAHSPFDTPCTENVFGASYVHPRHSHFMTPDSAAGQAVSEAYQAYYAALPIIMADARDCAMVRMLSEEQTTNLGRATAMQEFLLALTTAQFCPGLNCPLSVDALRRPLFEIPVDTTLCLEDLKRFQVVLLQLTHTKRRLTRVECELLARLDLLEQSEAVAHFDRPELRHQIEILQDLVSVTNITVELPCWAPTPAVREPALSEASLGIPVIV